MIKDLVTLKVLKMAYTVYVAKNKTCPLRWPYLLLMPGGVVARKMYTPASYIGRHRETPTLTGTKGVYPISADLKKGGKKGGLSV